MKHSLSWPLVSICIPTYNGEAYIESAMASALSQTYAPLEIVVSDDASADETLNIVERYKRKTDIPIHIFKHMPQGIGANWNYCVKQAKGEYIKFLFQDDILEPDCIAHMATMAKNNSNVGLVYCKRRFFYDNLTPKIQDFISFYGNLHRYWQDVSIVEGVLNGKVYLKDRQFLNSPKNKIGEPTAVLLKRECFDTVGWFREDLQQVLDYEYWYRVMTRFDVGFVNDALVGFRLHDAQASILNKNKGLQEQHILFTSYYKHLFWYLRPKNQWKLLKLCHPVFKTMVGIKHFLKR
ncbi:glycosyltransferase family 2 protein [Aestuariivivens marinum]|uniref:glycosyltransferase family 2 protein n=1 Tax=Aestuariivivens marinum TaxID=2913555 RepID=UPI001F577D10|nr:glycosyltransferase family A protein [Aestuariivivens marinum]